MSAEEEQAVAIPSVRLQLEKASPKDLAANIRQVLVHPSIFFFADVMDIPVVQEELTRNQPLAALCNIFCFGTYADLSSVSNLPTPVTDDEIHRIRMLTLCTIAASKSEVTLADVQRECGLPNMSMAEALCVDCMQASLLFGKIDQQKNSVSIENVTARDPSSSQLIVIHDELKKFASHAASLADASSSKAAALKVGSEASLIAAQKHAELLRSQLQTQKEVAVETGASARSFVSKAH